MKQTLLLGVALGLGFSAIAQSSSKQIDSRLPEAIRVKTANLITPAEQETRFREAAANPFVSATSNRSRGTTIGSTYYDLQSNYGTVGNRLIMHSDGSMAAVWTIDYAGLAGAPDRGTGYNYAPSGGSFGPMPTQRIETVRKGWCNIGSLNGTGEVIVAHTGLWVNKCAAKGTCAPQAWTESTVPAAPDFWPRNTASGNTIHALGHTNAPLGNMAGAVRYTRSQDGGATWDIQGVVVPGAGDPFFYEPQADGYDIVASGTTVAFVMGGFDQDLALFKSTDNGTNWTKTLVFAYPIPNYNPATTISDIDGDGIADTCDAADSGPSVVLDGTGKAHVWFGRMRTLNSSGSSSNYFPGTDGMYYWNESMGAATPGNPTATIIAEIEDRDGDGMINIEGPAPYQCSMTGQPSGGVDANGNLYVVYTSQMENTTNGSTTDPESYRNAYYMYSTDDGATWSTPLNVTPSDFDEAAWPSINKNVGANVNMIYHLDQEPGNSFQAGTVADPVGNYEVIYDSWPSVVGINNHNGIVEKFEVYPNPTNTIAKVAIAVNKPGTLNIKVSNILGQEVESIKQELTASGNHIINLNVAKYSSGLYIINATVGKETFSKKLMIN